MSGEPYPGLNPDDANDRNLAPVQALHKVWDGAQGGGRNWQPVYLYREDITGNFAARVHDTDLQQEVAELAAALLAGTGTKDLLVDGEAVGNIAVGIGPTFVCGWIDVTRYSLLAWWVYAVAGNNVTGEYSYFAPYPNGVGAAQNGSATAIVPGAAAMCQAGVLVAGSWSPNQTSQCGFRGFRCHLTGAAANVTARFSLVGYRR